MLITIREASKRTGKAVRTIRAWIVDGRLPAVKDAKGYRWFIDERDLERKTNHNDNSGNEHSTGIEATEAMGVLGQD